jgi:hypothetical protein
LQKEGVEGDIEAPVLDNSQIEEIENVLVQLADRLEEDDSGEADSTHEKLGRIIEVVTELETQAGDDAAEAETQEEIKELVAKLLEDADIVYTPELDESLSSLTLWRHLAKEIKKLKNEEEADETLQDIGTHECITQLLLGFGSIKKTIERVSAIGKSALRYSFSSN